MFEKGGVPMFDIHRPNVCEIPDILIAVTDGLKGMTQAIEAVFPQVQHQTCIVHLIRASTAFVSHKDRKAVMAGLKPIYQANTPEEALAA